MNDATLFTVESIELLERDVKLRMPFRFGVVTLTAAPQAFVRARIRLDDGTHAEGMAAELMAPKWFDKNPALSNEDNFEQLRNACASPAGFTWTVGSTPPSATLRATTRRRSVAARSRA